MNEMNDLEIMRNLAVALRSIKVLPDDIKIIADGQAIGFRWNNKQATYRATDAHLPDAPSYDYTQLERMVETFIFEPIDEQQ